MSNPTPTSSRSLEISDITHVLLDIEGTTCPVSFVSSTPVSLCGGKAADLS